MKNIIEFATLSTLLTSLKNYQENYTLYLEENWQPADSVDIFYKDIKKDKALLHKIKNKHVFELKLDFVYSTLMPLYQDILLLRGEFGFDKIAQLLFYYAKNKNHMYPDMVRHIEKERAHNIEVEHIYQQLCRYADKELAILHFPGLGKLKEDISTQDYVSSPTSVPFLRDSAIKFIFIDYQTDLHKSEYHKAIDCFLHNTFKTLAKVSTALYSYYLEHSGYEEEGDTIKNPTNIWNYVDFNGNALVLREKNNIYIVLSCECEWEPEHGLEIVFKNGKTITKIGPSGGELISEDPTTIYG